MEGRHGRLKKWLSRGRCLGTLGFLAVFVLMSKGAALGSGWVLPLDGEAVFCLYYWISGEPMDDRDLEELSRGRGRPTYTDYKPSEMFTRNSLRRLRASLQQTIDGFDQTTRFVRTLTLEGIGRDTLKPEQLLPAPTPFIRAELSSDSRRKLMGLFRQALARCPRRQALAAWRQSSTRSGCVRRTSSAISPCSRYSCPFVACSWRRCGFRC